MAALYQLKKGQLVGPTRRGKGSKLMPVEENHGLPMGGLVASAQQAEVKLAMVKVPKLRGRPRTRPRELVADKGYDSRLLRSRLSRRGIKPCIPERQGKKPWPVRRLNLAGYGQRGKWNEPMPGWATIGGWWSDMSVWPIST
jgi:hypothetical protein